MLLNYPCNCDGRSIDDGFPIIIKHNWRLGIYVTEPTTDLVKTNYSYIDNKLCIDVPFENDVCTYALNFKTNLFQSNNQSCSIKCNVIENDRSYNIAMFSNMFIDGDQNIVIGCANLGSNFYDFTFCKTMKRKFTVKVHEVINQDGCTYDKLLFELNIYPRHISEPCGYELNRQETIYTPSIVFI